MRSGAQKVKRVVAETVAAQQPLSGLERYGLAALSVGLALGAALLLRHFHLSVPAAPLLLLAVAIGSWYGGPRPAVLAAILSIGAFYWYFVEPVRTIYIYPSEIPNFIVFAAFAWLMSWFSTIRRRAESTLREQANLLNLTHDTVFVMDMEGVIQYWNRGAEERYGWAAEQAVGRVVHDLLKTVFPGTLEQIKAALLPTGRWEGELVHTRRNGTQVVVASRWALRRDERSAPVAILETNNDITERKKEELELRKFVSLAENSAEFIGICDMNLTRFYVNPAGLRLVGLDNLEQAARAPVAELFFPEDQRFITEEFFPRVVREGRAEMEIRFRHFQTGEPIWMLYNVFHIKDAAGGPIGLATVSRDITERKRAEDALRRLNRELRAISNCNQALLRATDEQSLLEEICRIVCEEAGYPLAWVAYAEHDEARSVRPVASAGVEEGYLATSGITWADAERGRGLTGTAIRSGKSCCVQDFETDPRLGPWRDSLLQRGFRSGIALPLKDEHGNAFGSLTMHSAQPDAFTPEENWLLEELAGDLAFGIVTLRSQAARKRAEQEVALLSFALDSVREAAFLVDEGARLRYVNEEACRSLGYTREELLGMSVPDVDLSYPEDSWQDHWRVLKVQHSRNSESRHRTRDGRIFPVEVSANYFEFGDRAYNLALVRDISERKRAEERLRQSEAYLAEAQRLSRTGSWALDAVTREYDYWSEEMFRLFEVNPEEGIPRRERMARQVHPENWDRVQSNFERSLQEKVDTSDEYRFVLPGGTIKHLQVIRHPLLNSAGDVVKLVGTFVDITERKRAEEELRRTAAYLAEAQRLSHTGSWALDGTTRVSLYWSEETFRIWGFDPHQGLPTFDQILQRIHPQDLHRYKEAAERAAFKKEDLDFEYRLVLPDATVKHVHTVAHAVLSPAGEVLEVVGTTVDITERKRAEAERENLRRLEADLRHLNRVSMMGELAASVAHEVNQPLSGIVSNAGACLRWLAGDAPDVEEVREAVRDIVRDGKRAGEIIARIRALATKRAATQREKLDLNKTIQEILALAGDEARRKGVIIGTQFAADLLPVCGDRVQLQQVVLNLVMNAIEAMSSVNDWARKLSITTRNIDAGQVHASVEDSGMGLDPNTIARIFEPFYTTKSGGMGMGLSISRSIIQAHGGRLWATGRDGPGTIFHFTVPKYLKEKSDAAVAEV